MNHKGQVFVAFVILLPIILIFLAYIVDNGIILRHMNKLNELNKSVITYALKNRDKSDSDIKNYIIKNENTLENINISLTETVRIKLVKVIPSVFGQVIGTSTYKITSYYEGYIKNDEVILKKIDKTK